MTEVRNLQEKPKITLQEVTISPQTDRALVADITMAYNEVVNGKGRDRGNGRYVAFAHPLFLEQFEDNDPELEKVDAYYSHEWVGDYFEGDKTLEGTKWWVAAVNTNLARGVKQVAIVIPKAGKEGNTERYSHLADPEVFSKYLEGVERYIKLRYSILEKGPGTFGKIQAVNKSRHLAAWLDKLFSDDKRNWRVLTRAEAEEDREIPYLVKKFDVGAAVAAAGYMYPRGWTLWKARYGSAAKSENEPFLYIKDHIGEITFGFIYDNLLVEKAREELVRVKAVYLDVIERIPKKYRPRELCAVYSDTYMSSRPGHALAGVFAFQNIDDDNEKRKLTEHEMVHAAIVKDKLAPEWLDEGLAMFLGNSRGESDKLDMSEVERNELITRLDEVSNFDVDDSLFEYKGGQLLISFLDELYGRDFVFNFYDEASKANIVPNGVSNREVIKKTVEITLPIPFDDFVENFKDYIKKKCA